MLIRFAEPPACLGRNGSQGGDRTLTLKVISYWVTTAILVFGVLSGGVAELVHRRENVESIVRLGYPVSSSTLKRKHRAPVSLLNRGTERQASLLVMSHRRGFFRQGYDEVMEEREGMEDLQWLAERFEENRGHLRAVAYRMLGSASEADDAIQETWLRLGGSDASSIENLGGWLTTVVARVCLDMLRSRTSRREEALDTQVAEAGAKREGRGRSRAGSATCRLSRPRSAGGTRPAHPRRAPRVRDARHVCRALRGDRANRRALPRRGPAARQPAPPPCAGRRED